KSHAIETMSVRELQSIKNSLLTNRPDPNTKSFMQIQWDIVYKEVTSQIDSKVAKKRFCIGVTISSVILVISLVNLVRSFL
ncbi:hypothetical protein, partial [Methylophaga sp. UBA3991]